MGERNLDNFQTKKAFKRRIESAGLTPCKAVPRTGNLPSLAREGKGGVSKFSIHGEQKV